MASKIEEAATATGEAEATKERKTPVRSYSLTWDIVSEIELLKREWNTDNESAIARWLLERGLEAVKKGKAPGFETVQRAKLD